MPDAWRLVAERAVAYSRALLAENVSLRDTLHVALDELHERTRDIAALERQLRAARQLEPPPATRTVPERQSAEIAQHHQCTVAHLMTVLARMDARDRAAAGAGR